MDIFYLMLSTIISEEGRGCFLGNNRLITRRVLKTGMLIPITLQLDSKIYRKDRKGKAIPKRKLFSVFFAFFVGYIQ